MDKSPLGVVTWERVGLTLVSVVGFYLANSIQGLNSTLSELRVEMGERKVTEKYVAERLGSLADRIVKIEDLLRQKIR